MNIQTLQAVQQGCDGIAEIDYFFAKAIIGLTKRQLIEMTDWPEEEQNQPTQMFMLLMALSYAQRQGHSCLPFAALANQRWWQNEESGRAGFEFASQSNISECLRRLIDYLPKPACIRIQSDCLYTERYWQFEQVTQVALNRLHRNMPPSQTSIDKLRSVWNMLFPKAKTSAADELDWQQIAVIISVYQGLTVLSGGPGTGKTYTVARILLALQVTAEKPLSIVLAAPTGKAAQRLTESLDQSFASLSATPELATAISHIPTQAQTVHRLLGLTEHSVEAKYNAQNTLSLDVLIVDESSMLDLALMTRLLRAVPDHCRLILVGDAQQLPSVESGNVLPMLIPEIPNKISNLHKLWLSDFGLTDKPATADESQHHHNTISSPCVVLAQSHRFGKYLAELASAVNAQDGKQAWARLTSLHSDFDSGIQLLAHTDFYSQTLPAICDHYYQVCCAAHLAKAFIQASKFRVLTAMRQGESGTELLNQNIEDTLRRRLGLPMGQAWFKGQLLMITRNMHALGLYNGDIGIVWPDHVGHLSLFFEANPGSEYRHFDLNRVTSIQTVYAMTIHKSQGSEFDHVMLVLPQHGGQNMLSKELLYTGITRSQNALSIVADEAVFIQAVNQINQRYSGLLPVNSSAKKS